LQQDPPGSTKPGAVSEILALEKALYRAMIDRDFETLRDLLSDDLSYMHSTGVAESKAQYLAGVADGLYEYERIESHDVNLHIHLETAVITAPVSRRAPSGCSLRWFGRSRQADGDCCFVRRHGYRRNERERFSENGGNT
jgi:hypothetical protein